jgi:DNA-directed RNA polymerase specialized sigma24 family protein
MPSEQQPTNSNLNAIEDITAQVLYSAEVRYLPRFEPGQEEQFIAQAREGDEAARHAILSRCLPWLIAKATSIYVEYEPHHSDFMDLVAQANLEITEALPTALAADKPITYLMSVGALAMKRWCYYGDPLVRPPRYKGQERDVPTTVSLEAYDWPLLEQLAGPELMLTDTEAEELKMQAQDQIVYDALQQLSPKYRDALVSYYGLYGQPQQRRGDLAEEFGIRKKAMDHVLRRAKRKMAATLGQYIVEKL